MEAWSCKAKSGIQVDFISYSFATSASEEGGEWPEVLRLPSRVAGSSMQMDITTCSSAISDCEESGHGPWCF